MFAYCGLRLGSEHVRGDDVDGDGVSAVCLQWVRIGAMYRGYVSGL